MSEMGVKTSKAQQMLSGLAPIADLRDEMPDFRLVPVAAVINRSKAAPLFNHLVRANHQCHRHLEPDCHQFQGRKGDHHKFYHLRKPRQIARKEPYSIGGKVKTRQAGRYEFNLTLVGEEVGTPQNKLFVRVEDTPTTKMKCVLPKHRRIGCLVQPAKKA